ncbi:MAG: TlpA family protein disulfide reductase [Acidobacteria bacterium]|nr:TlpA family protein disulfide reductase [Acidobacteriota bacterium]
MRTLFLPAILSCSLAVGGEVERFPRGKRPDMGMMGFVDNDRKKCLVADFKGKVVVVDFWTIWCPPCRKSLPELHFLQKQGQEKGSLVVIPCNLDDELWPQGVYQFMAKNRKALEGFRYFRPQTGRNGVSTNLGSEVRSYPTTLVLDREGRLAVRWSGYGEGMLVQEINALLQEGPPGAGDPPK